MPHSNQVREFVLSDRGIDLVDVYVSAGRVLTGRTRLGAQGEAMDADGLRVVTGAAAKRKTGR
jgi:circadian clock protein KaiC